MAQATMEGVSEQELDWKAWRPSRSRVAAAGSPPFSLPSGDPIRSLRDREEPPYPQTNLSFWQETTWLSMVRGIGISWDWI